MKRLFIFAIILITVSISIASQIVVSPEKLKMDLSYLVYLVDKCYPFPWRHISREEFMEKVEEIKQELNKPMTKEDFWKEVAYLLHYIKDVHAGAVFPADENTLVFPFIPGAVGNRIFALRTLKKGSVSAPFEILKIEGKDAKDIMRELDRYTPFSTLWSSNRLVWILPSLWHKKELHLLIKREGEQREIVVKAMTMREFKKIKKQLSKDEKYYWFTRKGNIGILRIKSFKFAIRSPEKLKKFSEFLTEVFSENKDMTDLIIDVRNNPGGSWNAPLEIISHFVDRPLTIQATVYTKVCKESEKDLAAIGIRYSDEMEGKVIKTEREFVATLKDPIYRGRVWVLTNESVFSGGKFFVYVMKKYRLGKIVGKELLSDANITLWRIFTLPYTQLAVTIPTRLVFFGENVKIDPDYRIELTEEEKVRYILGKSDPMLQKAIELVKSLIKK